jgi:ferredoxin
MFQISQYDLEWPSTLVALLPEIPLGDREALPIWFSLYPLLLTALAPDAQAEGFFQLKGKWGLAGQEDTSHYFFYAHEFWAAVKIAPIHLESSLQATLYVTARGMDAPAEHRLTLACLLLMTLRQCGPEFLDRTAKQGKRPERAKLDVKPSLLSRLLAKPVAHRVYFEGKHFQILDEQEITTAAEKDKGPYHEADPRCYEGMGPIPVDCRSGSCGTCWVGVLGGRERLDPIGEFERKRMEYFGYFDAGFADAASDHPRIRLACQAKASGNVEIVIPPWNGVFGLSRRTKEVRPK